MAESEKKDGQVPEVAPIEADAKELAEESLEKVAGGMGAAVPHFGHASSLKGPGDPCCLG
ncbi:MAG: hypothetical protein PT977_13750 [Acidobacteriota bacterium]|nr:hypothetical protein [Acidobacteriota bacterium]